MSTLKLENIKHENSSTNNMVMDSDGSVSTTGNATVGGTLGVTGATTTAALTASDVTTTGSVGVGGAPNKAFHVRDDNSFGGGSRIVAALSPSITNGQDAGLAFGTYSPDDYWKQGIFWERTGSYGLGHLHIANRGTADSTTVSKADAKITINSGGYVTTPKVPSFMHASYYSYTVNTASNQVMTNSNVWAANNAGLHENGNSGWDFNTGLFTAPVAGRYFFSLTYALSNFSSGYFWTYLQVNGSTKTYHQNPQTSNLVPTTNSMVVELAANDNVRALWTNNYTGMIINYANFHGFLIG